MAYKFKISKPTFNVLTETNPDNLIFSSDYNTFKYYVSGHVTITITAPAGGFYEGNQTFAHNLGYIPFFTAAGRISSQTAGQYQVLPIGNNFNEDFEVYADATTLYFYVGFGFTGASTLSFDFYFKVFKNNLGL